jgi:hypothetical protein
MHADRSFWMPCLIRPNSAISDAQQRQGRIMSDRDISPEDAHKRAIEDYSQFSQYVRSAAQFAFGANGGAAAATLSYLTALINSSKSTQVDQRTVILGFAVSSSFFLAGVFFSMLSMYSFAVSKLYWGDHWQRVAQMGILATSRRRRVRNISNLLGWCFLVIALLAFIPGSILLVRGFFRQ